LQKIKDIEDKSIKRSYQGKGRGETDTLTINGIKINKNFIVYFYDVDSEYHSYTFPVINTPVDEGLENILISYQPESGSYDDYLIHYNITEEEIEAQNRGEKIDITGRITYEKLDENYFTEEILGLIYYNDADGCYYSHTYMEDRCCSGLHVWGDTDCDYLINNPQCAATNSGVTFTSLHGCPDDGGGSNPPPPPSTNNGYNPGPGSNSSVMTSCPKPCLKPENNEDDQFNDKKCLELDKLVRNPDVNNENPYIENNENLFNPRTAITNMYQGLDSFGETGFAFDNVGNFPDYGSLASEFLNPSINHINFKSRPYRFGSIHTHPVGSLYFPMFSPEDLYSLVTLKDNYSVPFPNTSGDALFVNMLTVKQAGETHTYAIKIDDFSKLDDLRDIFENNSEETVEDLHEDLRQRYMDNANGANGAPTQYQRTFLNFLKDRDLGVSLYEMEIVNQGTPNVDINWNKLSLNPNGSVDSTPCD